EAKVSMRRRLRWVKTNSFAIVACCLVGMAELSLSYPQQILDDGIAWGKAMRLLQLDQRLIKMTFSNEPHSVVQCGRLRTQRRRKCKEQEDRRNDPIAGHRFAPSSA